MFFNNMYSTLTYVCAESLDLYINKRKRIQCETSNHSDTAALRTKQSSKSQPQRSRNKRFKSVQNSTTCELKDGKNASDGCFHQKNKSLRTLHRKLTTSRKGPQNIVTHSTVRAVPSSPLVGESPTNALDSSFYLQIHSSDKETKTCDNSHIKEFPVSSDIESVRTGNNDLPDNEAWSHFSKSSCSSFTVSLCVNVISYQFRYQLLQLEFLALNIICI